MKTHFCLFQIIFKQNVDRKSPDFVKIRDQFIKFKCYEQVSKTAHKSLAKEWSVSGELIPGDGTLRAYSRVLQNGVSSRSSCKGSQFQRHSRQDVIMVVASICFYCRKSHEVTPCKSCSPLATRKRQGKRGKRVVKVSLKSKNCAPGKVSFFLREFRLNLITLQRA